MIVLVAEAVLRLVVIEMDDYEVAVVDTVVDHTVAEALDTVVVLEAGVYS